MKTRYNARKPISQLTDTNKTLELASTFQTERNTSRVNDVTFDSTVHRDRPNRLCSNVEL